MNPKQQRTSSSRITHHIITTRCNMQHIGCVGVGIKHLLRNRRSLSSCCCSPVHSSPRICWSSNVLTSVNIISLHWHAAWQMADDEVRTTYRSHHTCFSGYFSFPPPMYLGVQPLENKVHTFLNRLFFIPVYI